MKFLFIVILMYVLVVPAFAAELKIEIEEEGRYYEIEVEMEGCRVSPKEIKVRKKDETELEFDVDCQDKEPQKPETIAYDITVPVKEITEVDVLGEIVASPGQIVEVYVGLDHKLKTGQKLEITAYLPEGAPFEIVGDPVLAFDHTIPTSNTQTIKIRANSSGSALLRASVVFYASYHYCVRSEGVECASVGFTPPSVEEPTYTLHPKYPKAFKYFKALKSEGELCTEACHTRKRGEFNHNFHKDLSNCSNCHF